MTTAFHDLPHDRRMQLRGLIAKAGGEIVGYVGRYVQVAIPNPSGPFYAAMEKAGLVLHKPSLHYFPLGSDAPPASLRHDGRFPGSAGFWLYGNYAPADEPADTLFPKGDNHE